MSAVRIDSHGNVAIVRLKNGVTNSVNLDLVNELSLMLAKVKDEYRGLVLAGKLYRYVMRIL